MDAGGKTRKQLTTEAKKKHDLHAENETKQVHLGKGDGLVPRTVASGQYMGEPCWMITDQKEWQFLTANMRGMNMRL